MAEQAQPLEQRVQTRKITTFDAVKMLVAVYLGKDPVKKLIGDSPDKKDLAKDVIYITGGGLAYRYLKNMGVFDGLKVQSDKLKEKFKEYAHK
ncbi:hypothetical protein JW756_05050 [Candidatus Woesearchaeota archaeon]|nr:hypothetical protein [Candidatus Woesearchaeota archaeon]